MRARTIVWACCGLIMATAMQVNAQTSAAAVDPRAQPEAASAWVEQQRWVGQAPAIATANPLATQAGWQMLRQGGCAIDAAIAAQWVLGLVEPQSSGIGGGAFLVYADGKKVQTFDGRETAPSQATEDLFLRADGSPMDFRQAVVGGRAVGVPGVVKMLSLAHEARGCLPWADLIEPARALALRGFEVSPRLHGLLSKSNHALLLDPVARGYFFDANGQPWPVGHRLKNPAYADTLERIAKQGPAGFYTGPVAQAMVDKVRHHATNPGLLSLSDLASYTALERAPICFTHKAHDRPWRVCGMGPPSSGTLAVGQILGTLQARAQRAGWSSEHERWGAAWLHAYLEAARLAFADRALYLADPDFVQPPAGDWHALLAPKYLASRAALIDLAPDTKSLAPAAAGRPEWQSSEQQPSEWQPWAPMPDQPEYGTSHLSVVDGNGHLVSMTSSIETAFGAQQMVRGFLLNNQLTDFSFVHSGADGQAIANRVQAGKRPRSSMAPVVVLDAETGEPLAALGSPGGGFIIHYVSKTLWGLANWQLEPQAAVALPNFGTMGGATLLERGRVSPDIESDMVRRGPAVRSVDLTSGIQVLIRRGSQWQGSADPRREGAVQGAAP